jgi:hypothetical protein
MVSAEFTITVMTGLALQCKPQLPDLRAEFLPAWRNPDCSSVFFWPHLTLDVLVPGDA